MKTKEQLIIQATDPTYLLLDGNPISADTMYLADHLRSCQGRKVAIFNPHAKPEIELPVIYGFNNGGSYGFMSACLVAQDGTELGGHCCSEEGYMPSDLGVLEGTREDRHETFKAHYPDGYRMEFVGYNQLKGHAGLDAAIHLAVEKQNQAEAGGEIEVSR